MFNLFSDGYQKSLLLAALFVLPLAACALRPEATVAQTTVQAQMPERTLSVTGQGIQMIPTTLTQVTLGISVQAQTADAAQEQAAQKSDAVVTWLKSQQSVEKLETAGISLSPRYDYSNDRQTVIGYESSNTISFRVPTENAGAVMDEAVRVGASRIDGVSFVATDDAIAAARQRALESAVADGNEQADTVLAALGLSRKEVINISIGSVSAPPPSPVQASASQSSAKLRGELADTPVIGQEQTIDAQVTLSIRY